MSKIILKCVDRIGAQLDLIRAEAETLGCEELQEPMEPEFSQAAINLIKNSEELRFSAYLDHPGGTWTIGWGHTGAVGGVNVGEGMRIGKDRARLLLAGDMRKAKGAILDLVNEELNNNQLSALISFVFNVGARAFETSTLLKKLRKRNYFGAANEFERWIYGTDRRSGEKIRLDGLITRRAIERDLFCSFPGGADNDQRS